MKIDSILIARHVPRGHFFFPNRCKDMRYPSNLPQISIVIPFRDEVLSVLLRTMYSILGNTDSSLLKEIILVDDGSTKGTSNLPSFLRG